MIENVSTQLTVFHCFAHCLLPGRAFASLYALLFLEKEAEIGGRVICRTNVETLIWAETGGGGGGGRSPGHPPGKLQVANHFQEEKLVRASLEKHPPPPPLELSGSAHACLTVEFYFSSSFFACNRFSYYTF